MAVIKQFAGEPTWFRSRIYNPSLESSILAACTYTRFVFAQFKLSVRQKSAAIEVVMSLGTTRDRIWFGGGHIFAWCLGRLCGSSSSAVSAEPRCLIKLYNQVAEANATHGGLRAHGRCGGHRAEILKYQHNRTAPPHHIEGEMCAQCSPQSAVISICTSSMSAEPTLRILANNKYTQHL